MGSAYTAAAEDADALGWNPAGLSVVPSAELALTHAELFAGTRYDFAGLALPLKSDKLGDLLKTTGGPFAAPWSLGVGAAYVSQGGIEARDENRQRTGEFTASDAALQFGASRVLGKKTSFGAAVKALRQSIGGESAQGWALDMGFFTRTERLNLGFSLQNLGPAMRFVQERYSLPLTVSAGAGCRIGGALTLTGEARHRVHENSSSLAFGGEFALFETLALRAGYLSTLSALQKQGEAQDRIARQFSGLAAGLGLRFRTSRLDYAFAPAGDLGLTQRISFTFSF